MKNCENCNKLTSNPKYCSRSCAAISSNKTYPKRKTKKKCSTCGDLVKSYRHSFCETHQKEYLSNRFENLKELTLKDYWNKKSLKNLHKSSKNAHIRAQARNHFKNLTSKPCANCGYDKHVELCHIKPIRDFDENSKIKDVNSYENLIQLCPNCHWEFDNNLLSLESMVGIQPTT